MGRQAGTVSLTPTTNKFLRVRLTEIEQRARAQERQRIMRLIAEQAHTTDEIDFAAILIKAITPERERPENASGPARPPSDRSQSGAVAFRGRELRD